MVQLLLSEPDWNREDNMEAAKLRISLLNRLEPVIWSVITSGGRSEARLWLCSAVAGVRSIGPHQQRELFVKFLRSKPRKRALASQLLQMIFEKWPHRAGAVLALRSHDLERFFEGNPKRILQWFSNFSREGPHKKGAKALSHFAFVNRDICWEELEWMGKHGQSPAIIATKPHYFLDLDVQRTVENFLENVPEFWSSKEFAESLQSGEILSIDSKFFEEYFVDLMYKEDSEDVWLVVDDFLMEESFSALCHRLLVVLEERDLCVFLDLLCQKFDSKMEPKYSDQSSSWLEVVLSKCGGYESIDHLLLINASINQGRQLLRLLRDEECQEEQAQVKDLVLQISGTSSNVTTLAPVLREYLRMKNIEAIKLLGLESWVVHYRLSEECQSPESWESLFVDNGIRYRRAGEYGLVHCDELPEESDSELDDRVAARIRRKKKNKSRKKRRRNLEDDDQYNSELLDFDMSSNQLGSQSRAGSWQLSTDGFSALWTNADLPEHISKHCFTTWIKWVFAKKSSG